MSLPGRSVPGWRYKQRMLMGVLCGLVLNACKPPSAETARGPGAQLYRQHCSACHGLDGGGRGRAFPPLAGSEWLALPPPLLAELLLRGISGDIKVSGATYRGQMPAQRHLSDQQLNDVLVYVLRHWGKAAEMVPGIQQWAALRVATQKQGPLQAGQLTARLAAIKEAP